MHGKKDNKACAFEKAFQRVIKYYFSENGRYDGNDFERRFRIPRVVFHRNFSVIDGKGGFKRRSKYTGKNGIYPLILATAALFMLRYSTSSDSLY